MKRIAFTAPLVALLTLSGIASAGPAQDLQEFRDYYFNKFEGIALNDYQDGVYAINEDARTTFEALMDFPPFEDQLAHGQELFETPFANGKGYADCFPNGGIGIRQNYPMFDAASGQIKTIEGEINACRKANGEKPLKWKKGDMAAISAYMASTSNGKKINIIVPNDERALAAYEQGKRHFYMKRGQLNLSCANCHQDSAGKMIRADTLSPALGHVTHFPVYRQKWGELGTLHRRYGGCNKQVRAKPFKAQSKEYRALEYFHTYMSNGIEVNAPSVRK